MRPAPLLRFATVVLAAFPAGALGVAPKENRIDFAGRQLALWEKRAVAPKAAILLVHGRTWSSRPDFDLQVPGRSRSVMDSLVARGYAVYALDLPGYGGSPRLATGWLSPNEAVDATGATLRWVATHGGLPGKPALFGWSNGARVAHLTAQRHPGLISDVILFGFPGDPAKRLEPVAEPATPPRERNTGEAAGRDFITPGSIEPEAVQAFVTAALASDPVRSDWRRLEEWNETDPAKLPLPVLLLQGVFDPFAPIEAQARSFAKFANPDRQWIVLPHSDHAALIEQAHAAFIAAIVNFLERPRTR
ncbi:MAG: alpha/beta fold hydrolase [Verrucomicrobia bacterium]|nr:alpha/beta fold hydrolase [Verrucomicrobiota bacterium]